MGSSAYGRNQCNLKTRPDGAAQSYVFVLDSDPQPFFPACGDRQVLFGKNLFQDLPNRSTFFDFNGIAGGAEFLSKQAKRYKMNLQ